MGKKKDTSQFELLKKHGKKLGLDIRFLSSMPDEIGKSLGYYEVGTNKIRLLSSLRSNTEKMTYVLAHEIGHHLDFKSNRSMIKKYACFMDCFIVFSFYGQVAISPKFVRKFIYEREREAFRLGEKVMRDLGIKLDRDKMKELKEGCLGAYRELLFL